ncbi:60S ribosomal protein L8 [Tieghemiomyces parasiticus]|uniref:60S ribosomal protein L8 n=1 Tax=Tieghemiomyces parasiticus TaxID=78921 RepID=A0A9W8A5L2_9FUNG|nr:60S ribosomal protein L8 [Tieghemiomyces parasiticus]
MTSLNQITRHEDDSPNPIANSQIHFGSINPFQAPVKRASKVAPAPSIARSKKAAAASTKNPLFVARPKNFTIGNNVQPRRDLTHYTKWPKYVRLQRQRKVLMQRLRVPPAINQFSKALDRNQASQLLKLANKYRPESRIEKRQRLLKAAAAKAEGKKDVHSEEKPFFIKHGINHITKLVESKRAQLVVIASDVDPIEIIVWLPALCRKMGIPYCVIKSKARLGAVVHKKTATTLAFTDVRDEDKAQLATLVSSIKTSFNDNADELRRQWGGGILSARSQSIRAKKEREIAKTTVKL